MEQITANGLMVRGDDGRLLPGTKPTNIITPATARDMQAKRWEKARRRAQSRIVAEAASIDPTVKDVYDAHALMLTKQYTTILDSDKPRMDDTQKLAQMIGTEPTKVQDQAVQSPLTMELQALASLVLAITDAVRVIPMRSDIGQYDE